MISKLVLKNFQCHGDKTVEFIPGVNVIIGDNESGKTALLRSARWVIENEPRGETVIKEFWNADDDKKASVRLTFDDNAITRERNTSGTSNDWIVNGIRIYKPGKVPDNVIEIIPSTEIRAGDSSINVCFAPNKSNFLIDEGSTDRAKYFDELSGVLRVGDELKAIQKEIKDKTTIAQINKAKLIDIKDRAAALNKWIRTKIAVDEISPLVRECEALSIEYDHFKELTEKYEANAAKIRSIQVIPELPIEQINSIKANILKIKRINLLVEQLKKNETKLVKLNGIKAKSIDLGEIESKIGRIRELEIAFELSAINLRLENTKINIQTAEDENDKIQKQLQVFTTCPICNRPIQ